MRGTIDKFLPGELEGTLRPEDYGFEVIPVEPMTYEAQCLAIAALYRAARYRTGVEIPQLEKYLKYEPYDPEPARRLVEKHKALPNPYICSFGSSELQINPGVFCPTLTNVSPFLLQHVDFRKNERVLDAFTGSGAFAINAALKGSDVVAYDASPDAVTCARQNADRNHVADRIDIKLGTLHEAISPSERFNLIIANPPLIPEEPAANLETALFDTGLDATKEFIAALPTMLDRNGRCYLTTSDVIERRGYDVNIEELCEENKLSTEVVAKLHLPYESYRVHKIQSSNFRVKIESAARKLNTWLKDH